MTETNILDSKIAPSIERRRKLLPTWIKIFLWIFMVFGAIAPIGLILGILGIRFSLSLYGLETIDALTPVGIFVLLLFAIKGTVSFGLWTEKDWAVKLAILDGIIGIVTCVFVTLVLPFIVESNGFHLNLRLELIALIPYLIKMNKIKGEWANRK